MSQYGFVYILGNKYMPTLIKIGCTERSPRQRAEELSKHTGVPAPFRVLCYAEFEDFQSVERNMHEWCKEHRVSSNREFFEDCLTRAVQLLWFHPQRLSFTDATLDQEDSSKLRDMVCEPHQYGFGYLRNPWGKKEKEDENQARWLRHYNGDFGDDLEDIPAAEAPQTTEEAAAAAADALLKAAGEAATQDGLTANGGAGVQEP